MSILKIVEVPNPILKKKSKKVKAVDKKIKKLISDMKQTLKAQSDPEGIGLAAPQVGKNLRLFLMDYKGTKRVVINPEVLEVTRNKPLKRKKGEEVPLEGCLSLPHYYSPIRRVNKIKIKYLDGEGEKQIEEFRGFEAQIVAHEIDHLDGKIFIDHVIAQGAPLFEDTGNGFEEVEFPA